MADRSVGRLVAIPNTRAAMANGLRCDSSGLGCRAYDCSFIIEAFIMEAFMVAPGLRRLALRCAVAVARARCQSLPRHHDRTV